MDAFKQPFRNDCHNPFLDRQPSFYRWTYIHVLLQCTWLNLLHHLLSQSRFRITKCHFNPIIDSSRLLLFSLLIKFTYSFYICESISFSRFHPVQLQPLTLHFAHLFSIFVHLALLVSFSSRTFPFLLDLLNVLETPN